MLPTVSAISSARAPMRWSGPGEGATTRDDGGGRFPFFFCRAAAMAGERSPSAVAGTSLRV